MDRMHVAKVLNNVLRLLGEAKLELTGNRTLIVAAQLQEAQTLLKALVATESSED